MRARFAGLQHHWEVPPAEAVRIQQQFHDRVSVQPLRGQPSTIAGLDVHAERAAVAVLSFPDLTWITGAIAETPISFPYVPGLLSFREVPAMLAAVEQLDTLPDLFLCDGHGVAHPRRFGIACHWGLWVERPTIGCAKSRLCGHHRDLAPMRGATAPLIDDDEEIGAVVRTRTNVRPVYVSVGHLTDLHDAVRVILSCTSRYRLPEPLRMAHAMAKTAHGPKTM